MNIGELFIKLGFDVDDEKLRNFQSELNSGFTSLLKITAAATGALYAFDRFVEGSINNAVAMRNFKTVTGESIDELQRWQVAATMANTSLSVDQVTASVSNLNKALADISMGRGNAAGVASMLIGDVRGKSAFEVLEELRKNYQANVARWGLRQTNDMIAELGIDPGMINALKLTNEEFDNLVNNRILDPESQQKLINLGNAIASVKRDFMLFKDQMVAEWSPKIIEGMQQVIPVLNEIGQAVSRATELFMKLPGPAEGAAFIAFCLLVAPKVTLLAAGITILVGALADLDKFLNGEDSVIGRLGSLYKNFWSGIGDKITPLFDHEMKNTMPITLDQRRKFWAMMQPDEPMNPNGIDITNVHSEAELDRLLSNYGNMASAPTNVTVNNNIDIHADNNPEAIGDAAGRAVQPSYNRVGAQLNNGPPY